MKTVHINAVPASNNTFAPFGRVISLHDQEPAFTSDAFDFYNALAIAPFGSNVSFGMVDTRDSSMEADTFERHFRTPELVAPLSGEVVVIMGKQSTSKLPGKDEFSAFTVRPGTAILISPGIWHFAPYSQQGAAKILIGFREGTPDTDVEIRKMSDDHGVVLHANL